MRVYEAVVPDQAEGMRLDKYVRFAFSLRSEEHTSELQSR